MKEEKSKEMEFGRKYQIGNYVVIKKIRSLNKRELKNLRSSAGTPADVQKHLQRGGLPFIYVGSVSGTWSITFVCGMNMYAVLDKLIPVAFGQQEEPQEGYVGTTVADFHHLFNMWYADTCIVGDKEYQSAKANALQALIDRQKAVRVSKEEDEKTLEELKTLEEANGALGEMAAETEKPAVDTAVAVSAVKSEGGDK